jgi:hypothetical protein
VKLKCPECGNAYGPRDLFCRKCGIRLKISPEDKDQSSPFLKEVINIFTTLKEFRSWIDQRNKKNIRFMRDYKERIVEEIGPSIREFSEKHKDREEGQSPLFGHITEILGVLSRG